MPLTGIIIRGPFKIDLRQDLTIHCHCAPAEEDDLTAPACGSRDMAFIRPARGRSSETDRSLDCLEPKRAEKWKISMHQTETV